MSPALSPSPLTVAAVQLTSTDDVAFNLGEIRRLVTEAAQAGATFVTLPENAVYLRIAPDAQAPMEPLDGPLVHELRALARELCRCVIVSSAVFCIMRRRIE